MNTLLSMILMVLPVVEAQVDVPSTRLFPAWIEVTCPADVRLTIQGHRMHSTGTMRRFASPPLPPGQVFTYELRAFRGRQEVAVRQVDVEAGRTTHVVIDDAVMNFGVDVDRLKKTVQPVKADTTLLSADSGRVSPGNDPLPDPTRRRLTVIGPEEERKRARDELAGPLRELVADYVVQDYAPDHWAVTKPGFVTTGKPTVYGQEADGRVLFRQDDLSDLRLNLEAVRKSSPDYKPERDPDHRKTPGWPGTWQEWVPIISLAAAGWFLWKSARRAA